MRPVQRDWTSVVLRVAYFLFEVCVLGSSEVDRGVEIWVELRRRISKESIRYSDLSTPIGKSCCRKCHTALATLNDSISIKILPKVDPLPVAFTAR